jgi:hypothetical protein
MTFLEFYLSKQSDNRPEFKVVVWDSTPPFNGMRNKEFAAIFNSITGHILGQGNFVQHWEIPSEACSCKLAVGGLSNNWGLCVSVLKGKSGDA